MDGIEHKQPGDRSDLGSFDGAGRARRIKAALVAPQPDGREALETRIKEAKERLLVDLAQAQDLVRHARGAARRGLTRAALTAGGLLALGLVTAVVRFVRWRKRKTLRVVWR